MPSTSRCFAILARHAAVAALLVVPTVSAADDRPNVLVILADDLGYADTGFTGSKEINTPTLDRLAAGGVVCTNGYVTHPYCGPSRAGLITGRYQARFGLEINLTSSPFDIHSGLPTDEKTFATRLKAAGYRTGVIGKWHLGAAPPFHPNNRGFDYFYGFLSGGHDYFPGSVDTTRPLVLPDGRPHYSANECCYWPLVRNNGAAEFDEYLTTALSRDAVRFVQQGGDEPFCLYLAYNAPHRPLEAPREFIEKYAHIPDRRRRVYAAMIDAMDEGIGMVVDALRDADKLDNTLLFFLSDNGGVCPKPGYEVEDFADNSPFRSGKGGVLEGGSHVPFLIHWPAALPSGVTYEPPVSALDITATAVAVAGGDASGKPLDGVDLTPYLTGERQGPPHDALYWRVDGRHWAVRTPTAKYVKPASFETQDGRVAPELYDMVSDPYESTNVVDERPEVRAELAALWNAWNAENQPNRFLQAGDYQRRRLKMYDQLRKELDEAAAAREPMVVE